MVISVIMTIMVIIKQEMEITVIRKNDFKKI